MPTRLRNIPLACDGKAHLFFSGTESPQLMAISTTGCIAIDYPESPTRIFHWYFRIKGKELITLPPVAWAMVWSCRAPWSADQGGYLTRLHVNACGLENMDVRDLTRLTHFKCAGNQLQILDCSGLKRLKDLDCSGNQLTGIDVEGCTGLTHLRCGGNPRLRDSATVLLARARGESPPPRQMRFTSTNLFDL